MADRRLSQLTEDTNPPANIRLYGVDPALSGAAADKFVEAQNLTFNITVGNIPLQTSSGLGNSALTETDTQIISTKSIQVPSGSVILGEDGVSISSSAHEVSMTTTDQLQGFVVRSKFNASGALPFTYPQLGTKVENDVQQALKTVNSDSPPFEFTYTTTLEAHLWAVTVESPDSGTLAYTVREGSSSGPVLRTGSATVTADTETKITLPEPVCYSAGIDLHFTITGVRLKGTGTGINFQPFFSIDYFPASDVVIAADDSVVGLIEAKTGNDRLNINNLREVDEKIEDVIGTKVIAGTGINVSYNDTTGETTISSTGTTFDNPRIENFSIDIASRVDLNTDLNVQKTLTFDIMHQANISGNLNLVVTTGDDKTVSAPFVDGTNTKTVTLSGINTASVGTLTFQLTGTDTSSTAFSSNIVTIDVRTPAANELFYYGLSSSNNPASIDVGTLTSNEANTGTEIVSTGTVTSGQYFIILVPTDHDITNIVDDVLQQDVTSIFQKTTNVRQISSLNYNSYVIGPLNQANSESYTLTLA